MANRKSFARLGPNGRVTIPKRIREVLGLRAGDRIRFVDDKGEVTIEPVKPSLLDFKGSVEPRERPEDFDKVRQKTKRRKMERDESD